MDKTYKTIAQWQQRLSPEAFYITREKGTEPPYSGQYNDHYKQGIYHCICCDTPLFKSDTKFDAGCGWPSYFAPINADHVREELDNSNNKTRTEILCNICDAHLGHVFTDGPAPTGLRYCINSAALRFEAL